MGALVLTLAAAIWIGGRWFKDNLHPDVAAVLTPETRYVSPTDNLFFALIGAASIGPDNLVERGQRLLQESESSRQESSRRAPITPEGDRLPFTGDMQSLRDLFDRQSQSNWAEQVRQSHLGIRQLIDQNEHQLHRYLLLREYRDYQDPRPPSLDIDLPPWNFLLDGQRLRMAQMLLAVNVDGAHAAPLIDDLRIDHAFWTAHSKHPSPSLIEKLIFLAGIKKTLQLTGAILRLPNLQPAQIELLDAMLTPFQAGALSLRAEMRGEFHLQNQMVSLVEKGETNGTGFSSMESALLQTFLFRPNQTRNRIYRHMQAMISSRQENSCPKLGVSPPVGPRDMRFADWLYNPVGNLLASTATPAYDEYFDRACDLEGLRRLVRIQLRARQERVADTGMEPFLQSLSSELADPYNDRPMRWDAEQAGIRFSARSQRMLDQLAWQR